MTFTLGWSSQLSMLCCCGRRTAWACWSWAPRAWLASASCPAPHWRTPAPGRGSWTMHSPDSRATITTIQACLQTFLAKSWSTLGSSFCFRDHLSCIMLENCSFMLVMSPARYIEPPAPELVTKLLNSKFLSCIDWNYMSSFRGFSSPLNCHLLGLRSVVLEVTWELSLSTGSSRAGASRPDYLLSSSYAYVTWPLPGVSPLPGLWPRSGLSSRGWGRPRPKIREAAASSLCCSVSSNHLINYIT